MSTKQKLDELIGLEGARRFVSASIANPDVSHAVLFYGAVGSGKRTLARILAELYMCTSPTEDGACGQCPACLSFARGNALDILWVIPKKPSNIIKVNAIRRDPPYKEEDPLSIEEFIPSLPIRAKRKVVIMVDTDRMNDSASNAFLKTLEEPPDHVKFILTTTSIGAVSATILSRCVAVKCELPEGVQAQSLIPEATEEWQAVTRGSIGLMKELQQGTPAVRILEFKDRISGTPPLEALKLAEEFKSICDDMQAYRQESMRMATAEALALFAEFMTPEDRLRGWGVPLAEAQRRIIANCHEGIVIDALFTQLLAR
ncbi:MAG: AAA family ATPase [Armatimonadetes bacterium]|nr:AAA family ATPase [Armatimonadota bacterium]